MKQKEPFSSRLKKCIELNGISASQLSVKTNISRSTICRYLKGDRFPKIAQTEKMAKALNVSVSYLLMISDNVIDNPNFKNVPEKNKNESSQIIDQIVYLCSLQSKKQNELILSVIQAIINNK